MSEIVFVHGIAQEQLTADTLEAAWRLQLSGGIRLAGDAALADSIRADEVTCRMAFYGHLFLQPGAQGDANLESDPTANALARAWLENVAERSSDPEEADDARRAIGANDPRGRPAQGSGAVAGWALRGLSRVPWFARPGFTVAAWFKSALHQVSAYLEDPKVRVAARESVLNLLTADTRVVIAHSLGSVVAWEALHQRTDRAELPLFITIGSPLGLRSIVYPNLWPQPPVFPPKVARWINIADKDDFIAAEPAIGPLFPGGEIDGTWTPDNGADAHEARFYLGKRMVGEAVAETFSLPRVP